MVALPAAVYVDASALLNRSLVRLRGREVCFYVHYWGGTDVHFDNRPHKHSFFEICYVMEGHGLYLENGTEYPLNPGTLFCSRPNILHQIRSKTGLGLIFVAFEVVPEKHESDSSALYREALANTSRVCIHDANQSAPLLTWQALLLETMQAQVLQRDRIENLACALLASFESTFADNSTTPSLARRPVSNSGTLVYQAKLFIRDNLSSSLRLIDVANHLHVSDRHLSRVFHGELGQTFTEYIRKERVQRSASLLSSTELSIKQIAEETGFMNVYYFTKVFTAEMGLPPGQFRKQLANG